MYLSYMLLPWRNYKHHEAPTVLSNYINLETEKLIFSGTLNCSPPLNPETEFLEELYLICGSQAMLWQDP